MSDIDKIKSLVMEDRDTWRERNPEVAKGRKIGDKDLHMIAEVGKMSVMLTAIRRIVEDQNPKMIVAFAKQLYAAREVLMKTFRMAVDSDSMPCPLCDIEEMEDGVPCTHQGIIRAALITMALLKLGPEPDMDLVAGDDDIPDLDGEQGIPEAS